MAQVRLGMEDLYKVPRWKLSLSQIRKSSPSRQEGMSFEDELIGQSKGVQFATRMASSLRLPPQTIFAAALFLHRYYIRYSLKRIHPYELAAGCVFLASKTEESPRKLKEVACATAKAALKLNKSIQQIEEEHKSDVEQWIRIIPCREDDLLQALRFDFRENAPYEHLNQLIHTLVALDQQQALGSNATLFINDSCRTFLSVEASMRELAVVALYWASKKCHQPIPDVNGEKWYLKDMSRSAIVQIINDMSDMINIVRGGVLDGQQYDRIS